MSSSLSEELWAIRMELKGVREAVSGAHSVDKAIAGVGDSTTRTGVAAEKAEKKTSRLSRAYASLGKTARWGIGFLGVGGVFALKSAIDNTEELSKTTTGLARNFGLSVQEGSRWAAIAHARDIDSKALSMTFGTLSSRMVEAGRKGGTALTPFHQLGLTQDEVAKGAHNFEWGLLRVADALGDTEGGAKRTTAAKALLGKGFQTLLPLFSEGAKGLREQERWADKYGVTLDGKTNDAIMDMVSAQRESKVATLGLQIALTKALMPAIEGGQHELQKFIATLNNDDLSADQKLHRIEQQFLGIEDTLIDIISGALPRVAEHGGELGLQLAGAVWHGFQDSDLKGKLVISAWLLNFMGGGGLIRRTGGKAGKAIAWGIFSTLMPMLAAEFAITGSFGLMLKARWKNLGKWSGRFFLVGVVLGVATFAWWLGTEIGKKIPEGTRSAIRQWGINAGENFVNFLILAINKGTGLINDALDKANVLSILGVDAPNIPEIGGFNFHSPLERQEREGSWKAHHGIPDKVGPHGPFYPKGMGPGHSPRLPRGASASPRLPRDSFSGWGGRHEFVVHTHVHLDGKEITESTARHVAAAEALG